MTKTLHLISVLAIAACFTGAGALAGCTGDDSSTPHDTIDAAAQPDTSMMNGDSGNPMTDSGNPMTDGGMMADVVVDTGPPSCYTNPTTHYEIINACTDAQAYDKNPTLPLLLSDGGLPPLP